MKGEVKKPEAHILPLPFIIKQTFQNGNRFPPLPSLDPHQVGDLPEIQFLLLYSFIKTPKEIGGFPFPGIFLPTKDSKKWKEVPFKPFVFKWKEGEKGECGMTCGFPFIIEKRPNAKGTLFFNTLTIFPCSDLNKKEDAMSPLLRLSHLVLLQLIERVEDKDPF
jgi:hypothetical protein